jgi:hypothetical protein
MVEATCPHCGCHMPYPIDDRRRLAMICIRCGKPIHPSLDELRARPSVSAEDGASLWRRAS